MARPGRPSKSDTRVDDIIISIRRGKIEEVKPLLLELGIDVCDGYSRTALVSATAAGQPNAVSWLIENRADVNHQDRNGYCALHFAGQEKQLECAELLIQHGAQLGLSDIYDNTPLWTAIFNSNGDHRLVDLYIRSGANLDHLNNYQKSPRELMGAIGGFQL
jgi:ankyrin repeat protein